ncbi:MAG TPA: VOC family protein [Patescibacteria group bacterium]|nr:VOC family protein [Patescibacteria group bacterium]
MLNLNNVMIGSSDSKALADFYEKVLGQPADLNEGDEWYSWNTSEKMSLSIGPHSEVTGQSKEPERLILNFETTQVKEEFERIKLAGATVVKEPYEMGGGWIATFADPDGNYFQLMTPWETEKAT